MKDPEYLVKTYRGRYFEPDVPLGATMPVHVDLLVHIWDLGPSAGYEVTTDNPYNDGESWPAVTLEEAELKAMAMLMYEATGEFPESVMERTDPMSIYEFLKKELERTK